MQSVLVVELPVGPGTEPGVHAVALDDPDRLPRHARRQRPDSITVKFGRAYTPPLKPAIG
jgi:hypothetical protein